jgi:hypothetical protein
MWRHIQHCVCLCVVYQTCAKMTVNDWKIGDHILIICKWCYYYHSKCYWIVLCSAYMCCVRASYFTMNLMHCNFQCLLSAALVTRFFINAHTHAYACSHTTNTHTHIFNKHILRRKLIPLNANNITTMRAGRFQCAKTMTIV